MRALICGVLSILMMPYALAQPRCFDNERFCFSVRDTAEGKHLKLYRATALPVVVTVYTPQLPQHHVTQFLDSDKHVDLGRLTHPREFWRSMRVRWTPGVLNATHDDTVRYSHPLSPIERYPLVQGYNGQFSHTGSSRYALDFKADVGTPVLAAREGIVIDVKSDSQLGGNSEKYADEANYVAILHDDGTTGEYYHLKYQGVAVKRGERVQRGKVIGYTGNTGFSSLPHLHFAVYRARSHGRFDSVPIQFAPPLATKVAN